MYLNSANKKYATRVEMEAAYKPTVLIKAKLITTLTIAEITVVNINSFVLFKAM